MVNKSSKENSEQVLVRQKIQDLEKECARLKLENNSYRQAAGSTDDLKLTEGNLVDSHFSLRPILDSSPFGVSIIARNDPNKRLFVNKRMADLFGFATVNDMLHFSAVDSYVNPEDIKKIRRSGEDGQFLEQIVVERYRKDGSRWWCDMHRRQVWFEGEDVIIAWHNDITDRKQAELAVLKNAAKLQAVFDNTPLNMSLKDTRGRYELINTLYASWFGLTPKDIVGKKNSEFFFDPSMTDSLDRIEREVLETGEPNQYEVQVKGMDGELYDRQITKFPVKTDDGKINSIGTITIDITEQKQNEETLIKAKEMAESANRAKSEFMSTMSHELRTPLTSSLGSLGLLKNFLAETATESVSELLEIATRNNEALLHLVNELLEYDKFLSGTLVIETSQNNICILTKNAINNLLGYGQTQSVGFVFDGPDHPVIADVNEHRFEQVLNNLLSNAAKFSDSESEVIISIEEEDAKVIISVKDNGTGIPEDFRDQIFGQFTQADSSSSRNHGGVGLGLAISKALTEAMGGTLSFETEVGVGSTFFISLSASK